MQKQPCNPLVADNVSVPGPTIIARPGDELVIRLTNSLPKETIDTSQVEDSFRQFDTTNLHVHGLHVSPAPGGDDIFRVVHPGETATYRYKIPEDHLPGTHWYHPHHHGATAIQAGGGMAGLLIIEDPPGTLPPEIEALEEIHIVALGVNTTLLKWITEQYEKNCAKVAKEKGVDAAPCLEQPAWSSRSKGLAAEVLVDGLLQETAGVLVNGQLSPTIRVAANRWYRWRMLYASVDGFLLPQLPGCETWLIAKDGIYLKAPRQIDHAYLGPGNRAYMLVRCEDTDAEEGSHDHAMHHSVAHTMMSESQKGDVIGAEGGKESGDVMRAQDKDDDILRTPMLTILVEDEGDVPCDLPRFSVPKPCYLADLLAAKPNYTVRRNRSPSPPQPCSERRQAPTAPPYFLAESSRPQQPRTKCPTERAVAHRAPAPG